MSEIDPSLLNAPAVPPTDGTSNPGATNLEFEPTDADQRPSWIRRHKVGLALGFAALSTAATVALSPLEETADDLKDIAVPVGVGMVTMEALWIGGAGMMLASVGSKLPKNPLKIRQAFDGIASKANASSLFAAGFWVNTGAAVGQFAIPAAAVTAKLPPESWGVLTPAAIDLAATVTLRVVIKRAVKEHATEDS